MWKSILLTTLCAASVTAYDWSVQTPLDVYVQSDDGYFSWTELTSYRYEENATTVYMLNMTSQKWMDETLTTKSIWYHMMAVAIPDNLRHENDLAYMWIEGGSNGAGTGPAPPDDGLVLMTVEIAQRSGCVGAYIRQVPNQSMYFSNDPTNESRSEDEIIAWTWHTFRTTHQDQPEVVARMPMTKAAKRGFDTIDQLVRQKHPGRAINRFIPGGGSKRGWTAWSACATDQRVVACNPIVMSLLNMNETLQSHYRNLGGAWTFVFNDYYEVNLTKHFHDDIVLDSPGGLWDYEDMFRYKERLGLIPKLMVSATGDEFFLPTDSHNWWDQMPGVKYIMMVPNAEHSLVPWYRKVGETVASFVISIVQQTPLPQLSWFRTETPLGGLIRFSTDVPPTELTVWEANTWRNDTRKDFRLAVGYPPYIHPVLWRRANYTDLGFGNYLAEFNHPETGYQGFFFEAKWENYVQDLTMTLTSEVHVTPDTFPAPPCYGEACYAYLT